MSFHAYLEAQLSTAEWLPFSWLMEQALYHPAYGYYMRETSPFGYPQGDFATAPMISSLFVHAVARQLFALMKQLDCYVVAEIGPGSGAFCRSFVSYATQEGVRIERYYLCERSPARRAEQRACLSDTAPIAWVDRLPDDFEGVVLANEVLDALPAEWIIWDQMPKRRGVVWREGQVQWEDRPLACFPHLYAAAMALPPAQMSPEWPYHSELLLEQAQLVRAILSHLRRGWFLIIDYGFPRAAFYHPDRSMGTLMCHYHHQAHTDPLIHLGEQDLSVHVDFTGCVEAALSVGAQLEGFVSQEAFLINMGIMAELADRRAVSDARTQVALSQAFHLLTHPAEMGTLCHVMALSQGCSCEAVGFSQFDRSHTL